MYVVRGPSDKGVGASQCAKRAAILINNNNNNMEIILAPRQLGYGTSLGCEAAVHAVRRYVESIFLCV